MPLLVGLAPCLAVCAHQCQILAPAPGDQILEEPAALGRQVDMPSVPALGPRDVKRGGFKVEIANPDSHQLAVAASREQRRYDQAAEVRCAGVH